MEIKIVINFAHLQISMALKNVYERKPENAVFVIVGLRKFSNTDRRSK